MSKPVSRATCSCQLNVSTNDTASQRIVTACMYTILLLLCRFAYFDLEGTGEITVQNLIKIFGSEEHAREIMGKHSV
jgi:hypothetical protein